MNKAARDAERAAVWTGYESRIALGERDTRSGFAALHLFMALTIGCILIFFFVPAALMNLALFYSGPNRAIETIGSLVIIGGFFGFVFRILIPVGFDIVWRMDILSNKIGYIRPDDVSRLVAVWLIPQRPGEFLRQRWARNA